jgi:hypothetical protein
VLYLLHAERPIGPPGGHQARHFHAAGIPLYLAAIWPEGTREDERRLKKIGHLKRHCPACRAEEEGTLWSPTTVRVNRLPTAYPKRSRRHPDFGRGQPSRSDPQKESGLFQANRATEPNTGSPSTTSTAPTIVGGYVFGVAVRPHERGWPPAITRPPCG